MTPAVKRLVEAADYAARMLRGYGDEKSAKSVEDAVAAIQRQEGEQHGGEDSITISSAEYCEANEKLDEWKSRAEKAEKRADFWYKRAGDAEKEADDAIDAKDKAERMWATLKEWAANLAENGDPGAKDAAGVILMKTAEIERPAKEGA